MNEEQYTKAMEIIEQIMDAELGTFEGQVLDLLSELAEKHEEDSYLSIT